MTTFFFLENQSVPVEREELRKVFPEGEHPFCSALYSSDYALIKFH